MTQSNVSRATEPLQQYPNGGCLEKCLLKYPIGGKKSILEGGLDLQVRFRNDPMA